MTKASFSILDLARRGAVVRWNELQSELADLVKMFPSLRDVRTGGPTIPGKRGAATTGFERWRRRQRNSSSEDVAGCAKSRKSSDEEVLGCAAEREKLVIYVYRSGNNTVAKAAPIDT
jgi:hypothetical protein